jgi:hypothetical protein
VIAITLRLAALREIGGKGATDDWRLRTNTQSFAECGVYVSSVVSHQSLVVSALKQKTH